MTASLEIKQTIRHNFDVTIKAAVAHSARINHEINELNQKILETVDLVGRQNISLLSAKIKKGYIAQLSLWTDDIKKLNKTLKVLNKHLKNYKTFKLPPIKKLSACENKLILMIHEFFMNLNMTPASLIEGKKELQKLSKDRLTLIQSLKKTMLMFQQAASTKPLKAK